MHELYDMVKYMVKTKLDEIARHLEFPMDYVWDTRVVDYAIEDVFETSAIADEGFFSDGDITLGCQRALANFLSNE